MAVTQIADIIVPQQFTNYIVQNTFERSALVMSGVATRNAVIDEQLSAGSHSFTVPFWNDLEKTKPTVNIVIINEYKIE